MSQDNITFDMPIGRSNVIKVIGVGGGGGNAVDYMYKQGFTDVDFVVCNTDAQALEKSAVPNKIQLGLGLTNGMGAGANPKVGGKAAEESLSDLEAMLTTNTKMIFLTAGMGGGTGTGAAPVIAKLASELGILTVGIVTIPFSFEGTRRIEQAEAGVEELRKYVDSLIVINNTKLREVYGNIGYKTGFAKADEVLATAARGISQVITNTYGMNIDLNDAKTVLAKSGTAIMGSATAEGDNRADDAIRKALDSPLLNDNKITGAKDVLLLIVSGEKEVTLDEMAGINEYILDESGGTANVILGLGDDESLGDKVSVTIVATGFSVEQQDSHSGKDPIRVVRSLDDKTATNQVEQKKEIQEIKVTPKAEVKLEKKVIHVLVEDKETENESVKDVIKNKEEKVVVEIDKTQIEGNVIEKNIDEIEVDEHKVIIEESIATSYEQPVSEQVQTTLEFNLEFDNKIEVESIEDELVVVEDECDEENHNKTIHIYEKSIVDELPYLNNPMNEAFEVQSTSSVISDIEEEIINKVTDKPIARSVVEPAFEPVVEKVVEHEVHKSAVTNKVDVFSDGSKRFDLGDYEDLEDKIVSAKPDVVEEKEEVEEELKIELITKTNIESVKTDSPEPSKPLTDVAEETIAKVSVTDPTDVPLSQRNRVGNERRNKLRQYNHRFNAKANNAIDELEREPAYLRAGIDVNATKETVNSRYTIGNSDDDYVVRSNNSFLHDNVD